MRKMSRSTPRGSERYEDAVRLLNSRRRQNRPQAFRSIEEGANGMPEAPTFRGIPSLFNMKVWLQCLGYSDRELDNLNVIHVAGTKGKGSTCAFTRSFLEARGKRTGFPGKVGLYTSPHLKVVRERIQINSELVPKDLFAKYVFEVWNKLESEDLPKPRYLQLLLLVAIHTFTREKVDVAVCETHNGGEYDATNVFPHPVATGIATIGMDHVLQLGPGIDNISWHKSGIFKPGSSAFSVSQEDQAAAILRRRASDKNVSLQFVDENTVNNSDVLAMKTAVQRRNASLAQQLANAFLLKTEPNLRAPLTPEEIRQGVQNFTWIGRFQQIVQGDHSWFLDGAHNELSVPYTVQWFANVIHDLRPTGSIPKVLIFSHISERDGAAILRVIAQTLQDHEIPIDHLIISTYEERIGGPKEDGDSEKHGQAFPEEVQQQYIHAWREYQPDAQITVEPTVEGALNLARRADRGEGMQTLITGSLYLVGSALRLLEPSS